MPLTALWVAFGFAVLYRGGFPSAARSIFVVLAAGALMVALLRDEREARRALRAPPVVVLLVLAGVSTLSAVWTVGEPAEAARWGLVIAGYAAVAVTAAVVAGEGSFLRVGSAGMAGYDFLTTWLLDCPRRAAWDVLQDTVRWPEWWRGVERVDELDSGDANGVDSRYAIEWRSRLPYPLEFEFHVDRVQAPALMEGRALGELEGTGRWRLFEQDGTTAILYEWRVQTTTRWMNLAAPVARPVFAYNHDVVMGWGGEGLARRLGARLLAGG